MEKNDNCPLIAEDKKIIEKEKEQIIENSNKKKSISSDILTEIKIESSKNILKSDNNIKESISPKEEHKPNINDSNFKNKNNAIINISNSSISNSNSSFLELYNELENGIENIKKEKHSKGVKISEKNKNLMELLFKTNEIFKRMSKKEEKYQSLFKEILNKINHYINNKNNNEIINLITEIDEKQKINISLKKEYQKIMNSKPYKDNSKLNERKKIEYKEQLSLYNEINNKIKKVEKILNNLTQKVKIYKQQQKENDYNNLEEFDENKLSKELDIYDNTIKKLQEEIKEKENELSILNNNLI